MPLPLIISFDGNIGSGKSTTCEEYEQYLRNEINKPVGEDAPLFPNIRSFEEEVCFLDEPVALWNEVYNMPLYLIQFTHAYSVLILIWLKLI